MWVLIGLKASKLIGTAIKDWRVRLSGESKIKVWWTSMPMRNRNLVRGGRVWLTYTMTSSNKCELEQVYLSIAGIFSFLYLCTDTNKNIKSTFVPKPRTLLPLFLCPPFFKWRSISFNVDDPLNLWLRGSLRLPSFLHLLFQENLFL